MIHSVMRRMRRLIGLLLVACMLSTAIATTPEEHRRTPDQTFLTFPEWYLVHSPAEYAEYLTRGGRPSGFPLFSHIGQFWRSYGAINREIAKFPFNGGYHLMVMVIGVSTTVEYGLKGLYEHTIGRLAEATQSRPVPEEAFAARYAQSYVDFIRVDPWYLYDFWSQLKALWADVPTSGGFDLVRRWERRFALTSELLVKAGYARLIKLGTQTVYDAPKAITAIVIDRAPQPDAAGHAEYKELGTSTDGSIVATIPRYEAFTDYAQWLSREGISFQEIAGNSGDVVVSLIVPTEWVAQDPARPLFEQPILTQPGRKRVVLATPVTRLSDVLHELRASPERSRLRVEHIYDF